MNKELTGHVVRAAWQILSTFALSIPMVLLGIPIVMFGLLFRVVHKDTGKPFSEHARDEYWYRVTLPDWSWIQPWNNVVDGFAGDVRGWWHVNCVFKTFAIKEEWSALQKQLAKLWNRCFDGGGYNYWNMVAWGAFRNTADYWRRFMISVPIDECTIRRLAGTHDEVNTNNHTVLVGNGVFAWNLLVAEHKVTGKRWYQLALVLPWKKAKFDENGWVVEKGRCLNIWLGWKFKMLHAHEDFSGERDYKRWKGFEFIIHPTKYYD